MDNKKTALITGASSGIGQEIAKILDKKGYDLIITARRVDRLRKLKEKLNGNVTVIPCDLSDEKQCVNLYNKVKDMDIYLLINNAGFGAVGNFNEIPLEKELEMIKTNCIGLHILTKLFVKDFIKKDRGHILNVASSAGLMPGGPLMSTYYATKAYVVSLTSGIYQELKSIGSNVSISALCPGPVDTEFNQVANAKFSVQSISAKKCAKIALIGLAKRELIIVPTTYMKGCSVLAKIAPRKFMLRATQGIQSKKIK